MTINRDTFFAYARRAPFGGRLTQSQVDGVNKILDEWERRRLTDTRQLAYILATVFHETAATMQPIRERGSEKYLRSKPYYPWVGEGLVQVTWEKNHRKFGATAPGQLMTWPIALRALFDGMLEGMFTGKKLASYFTASVDDPVNARRVVNGTDKAQLIAGHHAAFLGALEHALLPVAPADVKAEDAKPDGGSLVLDPATIGTGATAAGGFLAAVLGVVNSPWAFALAALLIVAGLILFFTGRLKIKREAGA